MLLSFTYVPLAVVNWWPNQHRCWIGNDGITTCDFRSTPILLSWRENTIIFNCNATALSQTNKECFKNCFFHWRKSFCNDGTCPWSQKRKTGWHWQIGLNFEDKQPSSGQIPCRFTIDWNCHNSVTHPSATQACVYVYLFF